LQEVAQFKTQIIIFINIPVNALYDTCRVDFAFPQLDKVKNEVCVVVT